MTLIKSVQEIVEETDNPLLNKHESWERIELKQIATILNGFAFKSKFFNKNKGFPIIRIRDVGKDHTDVFYTQDDFNSLYIVKKGELIVGMDGDFKSAFWTGPDALLNQRVCKITVNSDYYSLKFLELVLPGFLDEIHKHTSAVTVKHLSSNDVYKIPLPLPPFNEQVRIVGRVEELFSRLDAGVRSLQAAQTQLEQYRQTTLKQAYTGKLTQKWRQTNNPTDENTLMMLKGVNFMFSAENKRSIIFNEKDDLPISWYYVKLGDIVVIENGKTPKGINNASSEGEIPFYKVSDMNLPENSKYMTKSKIKLTEEEVIKYKVNISYKNNIIFPKRGGAIFTNKKRLLSIPSVYDTNIMGLKPINSSSEYVYYWLESINLSSISSGSNVPQINNKDIIPLKIPICTSEEQQEIVKILQNISLYLNSIQCEISKNVAYSKNLKQSVLKRTFEGRLIPQDPNDEPVSLLLERIKA